MTPLPKLPRSSLKHSNTQTLKHSFPLTLQQLEYLVAVDTHRQFSAAAEKCFVTQPTLSTMIHKLEEELGVKIFARGRQPVTPTEIGQAVIAQARRILQEAETLRQLVRDEQETIGGDLHLGIIPTLAPYLLPLFLPDFSRKYPDIRLQVVEMTTEHIVQGLLHNRLDVGILATPLHESRLAETPLFWEEFVVYAPREKSLQEKRYLLPGDLDAGRLLLLEEGHCIRSQVINLCALQRVQSTIGNVRYEAGSLETLRRLVESQGGITILPELALLDLDEDRMQHVRFFRSPAPVREISLVTRAGFAKHRMTAALHTEIVGHLPPQVQRERPRRIIELLSV
jgi:LysR family hydrogen peroxide-inducible transcriptional activator